MGIEELKIIFKFANFGNIACLHVTGSKVQNDINDEKAIILYNSLIGCKNDSIDFLLEEIQQLRERQEKAVQYCNDKIKNIELCNLNGWACQYAFTDKEYAKIKSILEGKEG